MEVTLIQNTLFKGVLKVKGNTIDIEEDQIKDYVEAGLISEDVVSEKKATKTKEDNSSKKTNKK